jgi:hypothetical protein
MVIVNQPGFVAGQGFHRTGFQRRGQGLYPIKPKPGLMGPSILERQDYLHPRIVATQQIDIIREHRSNRGIAKKKRLFYALRFAARRPAAARNCHFPGTYGTTEVVP